MHENQTTHLSKTLEDLRQQLMVKVNEAKNVLTAVNTIEVMLGQTKTRLADIATNVSTELHAIDDPIRIQTGVVQPSDIKPDEFLGLTALEAAKRYLKTVGHARHIDDIANAISRGGAAIKGSDWKTKLLESMTRSTYDVVKVQEGVFGLTPFYTQEQLEGLRSARRRTQPIRRPTSRSKKVKSRRRVAVESEKKAKEAPKDSSAKVEQKAR